MSPYDEMAQALARTFLCSGLPAQAAAFVNAIHPRAAIPTHYGTIVGTDADADAFAAGVNAEVIVTKKRER